MTFPCANKVLSTIRYGTEHCVTDNIILYRILTYWQFDTMPNTEFLTIWYDVEYRGQEVSDGEVSVLHIGLEICYSWHFLVVLQSPSRQIPELSSNESTAVFFHIHCNSVLPNHLTIWRHTVTAKDWFKYTIKYCVNNNENRGCLW
jgi:hypothetical protein